VIVGASVAGLASACALAQADWSVRLLERRSDLSDEGEGLLVQPNGLASLERLGALDLVRARGVEIAKVLVHDGRGRLSTTYDYTEVRHPHAEAIEIRPQALRAALVERAAELGVPAPRFGAEVVEVIREGTSVAGARCADGSELTGNLVVGADGRGSRTRAALGIPCRELGQRGSFVLGTADVRPTTRDARIYCGDGYGNGVLPLPDGTYFFDCITGENRDAVEAGDLEAWREVYERRVPCAGEFIDAIPNWGHLSTIDVRPFWAARRLAPGVVLVGDAAGSVHPHAGQGANLALEDAAALGEALRGHTAAAESCGSLRGFARQRDRKLRRYVLWSVVAAGSLDGPNRFWRAVRRAAFRSNRVGAVRRVALRQQAGLG
jgi:2-polyprenyl-6-methoxyphenol hydroxylase-like FAD-dependent oxidoreductase